MNKNILAIIPARGGSKGVKRKNIKELNGHPLIYYTIKAALRSKYINRVIVSTDDCEIEKVAKSNGAEVPYLRPKELAGDNSSTVDVVIELLNHLKISEKYIPEYIMVLQCTSPLRDTKDIDNSIEKLISSEFDGIVSVCEAKINPYWTNVLKGDKLEYFIEDGKYIIRRQDLPKIYNLNGAIYFVKREVFEIEKTFEVSNLTAYIMDEQSSIDIDNEMDFKIAELIMEEFKSKV